MTDISGYQRLAACLVLRLWLAWLRLDPETVIARCLTPTER